MRGAFYEGVRKIVIRDDLPKPTINPDEVLIKVKYCGICGSGVESYQMEGMYFSGIILGHEFSGEIVEVGDKVKIQKQDYFAKINNILEKNNYILTIKENSENKHYLMEETGIQVWWVRYIEELYVKPDPITSRFDLLDL